MACVPLIIITVTKILWLKLLGNKMCLFSVFVLIFWLAESLRLFGLPLVALCELRSCAPGLEHRLRGYVVRDLVAPQRVGSSWI